jgi:uncharacterized phage protein (TIGR01671 family)
MREIKFRAWNSALGEMWPHARINYGNALTLHNCETGIVLLQYTGLKDKNGVEIYEGDILETPYDYPGNAHIGHDEASGLYRGRVHYTPSKGFIQRGVVQKDDESEKWEKRGALEIRASHATVIGNTHQSPELLQ